MSLMLKDVLISIAMGFGLTLPFSDGLGAPVEEQLVGSGTLVIAGHRATVHLQVTDETGREYANTKKRGLPYSFVYSEESTDPVSKWVAGMRVGGQRKLNLAPEASGTFQQIVPANTPLIVVVTLIRASGR